MQRQKLLDLATLIVDDMKSLLTEKRHLCDYLKRLASFTNSDNRIKLPQFFHPARRPIDVLYLLIIWLNEKVVKKERSTE